MSTIIKSLYGETLDVSTLGSERVLIKSSAMHGCLYNTADLLAAIHAEGNVPTPVEPLADWERELLNGPSTTPEAVDARNRRELALYGIDRFDTHTCKAVPKDAIVTLRNTLPEVTGEESGYSGYGKIGGKTFGLLSVESYTDAIRNLIALREYVVAHPPTPPVDETTVRAIALTLTNPHNRQRERETSIDYARRLYLAGVRVTTPESK